MGIVRIELTKDLRNPFSSKELLERQDYCESTLFYTSFDSVSLPPRNSQIKLVKPLRLLLGQHFTHLLCFRSLERFYKLLSIPLCTLESLTSIETLYKQVILHVITFRLLPTSNVPHQLHLIFRHPSQDFLTT